MKVGEEEEKGKEQKVKKMKNKEKKTNALKVELTCFPHPIKRRIFEE